MKKKYCKALVIGKFQPLHKGHMALIAFARSQAEKVVVCLTAHANEQISIAQRLMWLEATYEKESKVSVCAIEYDSSRLTESSETDLASSLAWADYLREYFGLLLSG